MDQDNLDEVWRQRIIGPEQSVIGSMLLDPKVVGLVVDKLTADDFTMEINRQLFLAFRRLYLSDRVLDPVTVSEEAAPGDPSVRRYALELMDTTATAANIQAYIELARRSSQLCRLRAIGQQLAGIQLPEEALPMLKDAGDLLSDQRHDDEADMAQSMLEFYADLEHTPDYLPWGFPFLEENLYVERRDFVVLAGRPSDGKTALALHMAVHQAKTRNVGFFSLETGRKRLFSRLVSSTSGVPGTSIKRRKLSEAEYGLIADSAGQLTGRRMTVVEASGWTVEQIEARTMARKFDVVYIDYLQLVQPSRKRSHRNDEVADISRAMANMARTHGITVVALSQLSRPDNKTERREPVLADLRESGQIEQDADVVLFIWRKTETRSDAGRILTLAKNKEGVLYTWPLVFRGETQRFVPELSGRAGADSPRRKEPEYQQISFRTLPDSEPVPWEEKEGTK